jgi:NAD-dependent deacetylase
MSKIVLPPNKNGIREELEVSPETRIAFITGAGVSVGSGLPTYYGQTGSYTNLNESPEDIINFKNMRNAPHKIWDALTPLIKQGIKAEPCIAHKKIAEIQSLVNTSRVFTQNVDPLHKKAGSKSITQIHGNGEKCYCNSCMIQGNKRLFDLVDVIETVEKGKTPICPDCGERNVVPNIIAFHQNLEEEVMFQMYDFFTEKVDYIFVVGTQMSFPYIQMMLYDAEQRNEDIKIIDVNPDPNYINTFANVFNYTADDFFESLSIEK